MIFGWQVKIMLWSKTRHCTLPVCISIFVICLLQGTTWSLQNIGTLQYKNSRFHKLGKWRTPHASHDGTSFSRLLKLCMAMWKVFRAFLCSDCSRSRFASCKMPSLGLPYRPSAAYLKVRYRLARCGAKFPFMALSVKVNSVKRWTLQM